MKCKLCQCPIDDHQWLPLREREIDFAEYERDCLPRTIRGQRVCQACYGLYIAIFENPWFIAAHTAWMLEIEKLNKLRFGADYFKEDEGESD